MNLSIATTPPPLIPAWPRADERLPAYAPRSVVTPFARALSLLEAFTPHDCWLSSRELSVRCGMPASTTWRIAQSLVILGYLLYDDALRKYRLAASVLALGYGAAHNSGLQRSALEQMQTCADHHAVHISLGTRDRLEIVTITSCRPMRTMRDLPTPRAHAGLSSSPMGWALLSSLPESERSFLMHNAERRAPQDGPRLRRQLCRAVAQVRELGYCTSIGDWDRDVGILSAPVLVEGRAPRVISCMCAASRFTTARVQRELGPRLLALAAAIQRSGGAE